MKEYGAVQVHREVSAFVIRVPSNISVVMNESNLTTTSSPRPLRDVPVSVLDGVTRLRCVEKGEDGSTRVHLVESRADGLFPSHAHVGRTKSALHQRKSKLCLGPRLVHSLSTLQNITGEPIYSYTIPDSVWRERERGGERERDGRENERVDGERERARENVGGYLAVLPLSYAEHISSRCPAPFYSTWTEEQLASSCVLSFLPPSVRLDGSSTADLSLSLSSSSGASTILHGDVPLRSHTLDLIDMLSSSSSSSSPSSTLSLPLSSSLSTSPSSTSKSFLQSISVRSSLLEQAVDVAYTASEKLDPSNHIRNTLYGGRMRRPLEDPLLKSFLETSAESESLVGFLGLIKGIVGGIIKPVAQIIGDLTGSIVSPLIEDAVKPALSTGVMNTVGATIGPMLINPINDDAVPGIAEMLTDSLMISVPDEISRLMTEAMYEPVSEQVMGDVTDPISTKLNSLLEVSVPRNLDNTFVQTFGSIISNALSSSIMGALTHTLTQSPMQDYFCFYCHASSLYCAYCQHSPDRLYYNMYYVNYYSAYYSPYYAAYFGGRGNNDWMGEKHPDAVLSRDINFEGRMPKVPEEIKEAAKDMPLFNAGGIDTLWRGFHTME